VNFRLGKNPPRRDARNLKLAKYTTKLPPIPPACDFISKISDFPMYDNNTLGDCVAAAAGHMVAQWTTYADKPFLPSDAQVVKFYEFSGYNPADPDSDQGWDLLSALKAWRTSGLAGHKIVAFVQLETGNLVELAQAISLFGNAYIGVALPDDVLPNDPSINWTTIPWSWESGMTQNPDNGHCVPVMAYTKGLTDLPFVSWAAKMYMGPHFYENISDEAFAVVTEDWIEADGKSPSGFDIAQLLADLAVVTAAGFSTPLTHYWGSW
jgi:hypothetical protein